MDSFEQILSQIDARVRKLELHLSETQIRQRHIVALFTTYALLVYVLWLASFFFITWPRLKLSGDGLWSVILSCLPILLAPIGFVSSVFLSFHCNIVSDRLYLFFRVSFSFDVA